MDLVNPLAEEYALRYSSAPDELLMEIEAYTLAHHAHAHMLSGRVQGMFLESVSRMIQPKRILEIGTFTGYSTLFLARGLQENGCLHTIELREPDADIARGYFSRSDWAEQIILHPGNALDIIPRLDEEWDLVFIDADKVNYINYYELTLPKVRPGGWILADNVFFHGQVLEEPVTGKNALSIAAFNEHVKADGRVDQVMLTVRDGLMLIRKK